MLTNSPNNDADLGVRISSGEIVNDKETKKKTWRDHYAKLGNENNDDSFCSEFKNDIENTLSRYDIFSGVVDPDPILDTVFTVEEVNGDKLDCNNFRGITLLSVMYKLLSCLIEKWLTNFLDTDKIINNKQGGFSSGKDCVDHLFVSNKIIENNLATGIPTYFAFIDVKKAFDIVWREGLWVKLFECGIKGRLWRVTRQMYKNSRSTVLVDGED
eukprot:Pgem_evm1s953